MTPTASAKIVSKSKKRLYLLLGILVGAGLVLGGLLAYTASKKPVPIVQVPLPTYVPTPSPTTVDNFPVTSTSTDGQLKDGDVQWTGLNKVASLHVFRPDHPSEETATYYEIGEIFNGPYSGASIIMVSYIPDGISFGPDLNQFLNLDGQIIALAQGDQYFDDNFKYTFDTKNIVVDHQTILPGLTPPQILTGPKPGQTIELVSGIKKIFDSTNLKIVFIDDKWGPVYTNITGSENSNKDGFFARLQNGFYIKMPDGTQRNYKLKTAFINDQGIPQFHWTNANNNTVSYNQADIGGCGLQNYISVISPDVATLNDLTQIGTSFQGEPVYELKDTEHKLLREYYENSYSPYHQGGDKLSYEDYLQRHPLLFWVDPFGRLVKLSNTEFQPMAECGKPVIYLYPEKTTNVSVQVEPQGGLTYSDPNYNDGWKVQAQPNGQLTELTTNRSYPYLFWEGRGGLYEKPTKGWVVPQAEVNQFLRDQLHTQGLRGQEIEDFMEFWLPRMQAKPYYFISFYGTRVMDQLAPLTIEPKPDTVIRLLMDFTPLDQPISVKPYTLPKPPARQGFTVIEWGGVIQ